MQSLHIYVLNVQSYNNIKCNLFVLCVGETLNLLLITKSSHHHTIADCWFRNILLDRTCRHVCLPSVYIESLV
jgi:hypothetical protein